MTLNLEENLNLTTHLVEAIERLTARSTALRQTSQGAYRRRTARFTDSALASRGGRGEPIVHITHDDLAAAVGSVRETVTKVVGELSRQGAINAGYGKIALIDISLLRTVAGE